MVCSKSTAVPIMVFSAITLYIIGLIVFCPHVYMAIIGRLNETECAEGRSTCPPRWVCCEQGCCLPATPTPMIDDEGTPKYPLPVLFLIGTLAGILVCCLWCLMCKRSSREGVFMCSLACCVRRPNSNHDSAGSVYPPPRYSRCNSFHQPAPPPYSEVTSKPDLYPLVYSFGDEEAKAGNYLMVHYFRNYVIRAPGSISATSTAESLNSSFICNAANEANSIIPPPYSCASNYEEYRGVGGVAGVGGGGSLLRSVSSLTDAPRPAPPRSRTAPAPAPLTPAPTAQRRTDSSAVFRENLITSPMQPLQDPAFDLELELIDCELYCDGSCKPRLGSSPPTLRSPSSNDDTQYEREPFGLRHLFIPSPEALGACESPPQPTSPTQTSRESTLRRAMDERRLRRLENVKKALKARKSSLYMPLSVAYPARASRISPGTRGSSRSAPATPCAAFVPNVLTFTQRVASRHGSRSSRLEEENDPLLADPEHSRSDHKF